MRGKGLLAILFISVFALIITACAGGAKTVLITGITVTGEDNQETMFVGETLQMIAQIQPENASNKEVIWVVENAAGNSPKKDRAEITEEGVLTGLSAGSVVVKATAKDASEVEGTKEITIVPPTNTFTIEASPTEGGNVSFDNTTWSESTSTTVNESTDVEIYVQSDDEYIFEGWYEGDTYKNKDNPYTVTVNTDKIITAVFKEKQYGTPTVTLTAPQDEIDGIDPQNPPTFQWQAQAGEQTNTQNRTEPTLIKYEIYMDTNPTPSTLVHTINDPNTKQWEITTELAYGQTYYWTVKVYQSDDKTNTSETRSFSTINQYTLTIQASPTEGGDVKLNNEDWTNQSSITVEEITDFELQATSTEGYYFSRWYKGEEEISTLSDFTFTLENDCTLTAKFMTNPETVEMITVAAGTFTMGDIWGDGYPDEKPAHAVEITHDFFMGKYEIQNDQFLAFLTDRNVSSSGEINGQKVFDTESDHNEFEYTGTTYTLKTPGKETFPAMEITWWGAIFYCNWLSEQEDLSKAYDNEGNLLDDNGNQTRDITKVEGYRLPTEAEWEYAARGGEQQDRSTDDFVYAGGNDLDEVGFFCFNSTNDDYPIVYETFYVKEHNNYYHTSQSMGTHSVGQKKANSLDLYDMSGNVWEWCYDYYASEYYTDSLMVNPVGPTVDELVYIEWEREEPRVIRGGSFHSFEQYCESSFRMTDHPFYELMGIGFRIVRTK